MVGLSSDLTVGDMPTNGQRSRYHSHTSAQYGDGIMGGIIFDGPTSSNWDLDLGPYIFTEDYAGITAWQVNALAQQALQIGIPPPAASGIIINGTGQTNGQGTSNQVTITAGKKYRLRLINGGIDSYVRVSLDNHIMTVMSADFVPINPFTTEWLLLAIGQRYDVVIHANQTAGNYWFRAQSQTSCFSSDAHVGRAIWTYTGVTAGTPSTSAYPQPNDCMEPSMSPYWKQPVPEASFQNTLNTKTTNAVVTPDGNSMVVWALENPIWVDYADPTLGYLMDGNTSYPKNYNVIDLNSEGNWNYWLVWTGANTIPLDHPIHLHGHDFYVIGQGNGAYDEASANLNWENPVRRDVATLPAGGWLALAFESNNAGVWLIYVSPSAPHDDYLLINSTGIVTLPFISLKAWVYSLSNHPARPISRTDKTSIASARTTRSTRATRHRTSMER
jgi:FtsP/CotA-like multicopper oxidase with cupredoxin domain